MLLHWLCRGTRVPKQDYPSIWPPGRHLVTLQDLKHLAVDAFPLDMRRVDLFAKFESWVNELRGYGVVATVWLDGSFVTEKPGPDDIDCVMWSPQFGPSVAVTPELKAAVKPLVDRAHVEGKYNLDLYLETPEPAKLLHREAYWSGFFGFCHERTKAKGFVELVI